MPAPLEPLLFLRHGATDLNLAGLRCGGDVDPPLAELGLRQTRDVARELAARRGDIDVIVVSDLQRTRQTAEIVARQLRGIEIIVVPAFNERRLGAWNGLPIADTQDDLAAGVTPPDGESNAEFTRRIRDAVTTVLVPLLSRRVLLVGSKGVARVLGEIAGGSPREPGNAELIRFDLGRQVAASRDDRLECAA